MSIPLTREQREVMAQSETPLRFVDPESKREYVLLRAELYERLWRIAQFRSDRSITLRIRGAGESVVSVNILRQLPSQGSASIVEVAGESVALRAYQIVVWVSLSMREMLDRDAPFFPAVLDTGHNHNFSIQERQLIAWARVPLQSLPRLGGILVNRQEVPLLAANVWIHRDRPGGSELLPRPFRLELPRGIAVYADGLPGAPRLPLLGLRGLVSNNLCLIIDGTSRRVSLRTSPTGRGNRPRLR